MEDLTVVVTGASSGVGLAAATAFARGGARVVLVGRDPGRLDAAVDQVRATGGPAPDSFRADFARLAEVRALASYLLDRYPTIDVLANNAGGIVSSYARTVDGFEMTIQTNHLAPFLLTNLLRDRLRGGRVVNTASDAHRRGLVDPDDLVGGAGRYDRWSAYGASKGANILFAAEAGRRWPDVLSTSYHPGVVRTRFGSDSPLLAAFYRVAPFLTTPEGGADTMVWLATAPAADIAQGGYYVKRRPRRPAPKVADPQFAARLWEASAKAVGL
ncbi:SDR family NAD(P)-dependent oxidoreductase [Planosporangium thailandense]|uniref:SDR family NAD(P)-dependent oxidoreductase n=1 Tax=Planosporangium thailandense TaxID=765197 RepID=A0ABX0XTQ5_9ACTN|nr:SDR family NAD(P)-dependent oxidoreductase [Planosporangium thailandense]